MGHSSQERNVTLVLSALETCLRDLGYRVEVAASAFNAAAEVYSEARQPFPAYKRGRCCSFLRRHPRKDSPPLF